MKAFAVAALCGALLPLPAAAADSGLTTIYASGQATVSAAPDIAVVSFSIASHASTAEQATGSNNSVYAHFNTGMRTIGIAAADIKTTGYNLNHVPPPPPCPPPPMQSQTRAPNAVFVQEAPCVRDPQTWGYFVNRTMSVTVHHLDLVGKVIDTAVAAGVNNVEGVDYGLSDVKSFFLRALGEAVVSARAQADVMAQAAGLHIVRVVSINSSNPTPLRTIASVASRAMGAVYQPPTQISPPTSLDVNASVGVSYLAQP